MVNRWLTFQKPIISSEERAFEPQKDRVRHHGVGVSERVARKRSSNRKAFKSLAAQLAMAIAPVN
jgi:hypothetical protein